MNNQSTRYDSPIETISYFVILSTLISLVSLFMIYVFISLYNTMERGMDTSQQMTLYLLKGLIKSRNGSQSSSTQNDIDLSDSETTELKTIHGDID